MSPPFRFQGRYAVAAPRDLAVAALRDADRWPQWWPQIRAVERFDEETGVATIRSALPITLRVKLIREIDDPEAGRLRARLDGDLRGWIGMWVEPGRRPETSVVAYAQECVVAKRALGRLPRALRPALTLNHALMMRSGMRGLTRHLSGPD